MYNSQRELIEALTATPDTLQGLLKGVSQEQALQSRGGDENWSVVEVMCHLRDAEEYNILRMRTLRDEADPQISGFDQEKWARERNYAKANLQEALQTFLNLRAQHLAELKALTLEQWERTGTHSKHGPVTITNHTLHLVWHDVIHLAQLARQLNQR